jgi:soluble lytic murein transglycosylase-like protein
MQLISIPLFLAVLSLPFIPNTTHIEYEQPPVEIALKAPEMRQIERKPSTPTKIPQPTKEQAELIEKYAYIYNVDAKVMTDVIRCESGFDETIQSRHYYKNGGREQSYGLAQWHIPAGNKKKDGTVITKEDALNPEVAIETMAWYFSQGKAHIWTCHGILASR